MNDNKVKNTTFLFIKRGMNIGGIEINMMRFISWLIKKQYRVIFLALKGTIIDDSFREVLNPKNVEIYEVNIDNIFCDFSGLKLYDGENVLAYSFDFYHFIILDKLKSKFKRANINSFFWLAHYQGYYPEEYFPHFMQKLLKPLAKNYMYELEKNNNIIYFHDNHLIPFIKHYGYEICNNGLKKVFYDVVSPSFDISSIKEKFYSKSFEIITIARIIFPHKGYMMGLVKVFANLKQKYSNLQLTIIGDGPNRKNLEALINTYDSNIRDSIQLLGTKSFQEISECCKTAKLNVSLAGGVEAGAINGVLSIPVRHSGEDYTCEAYGYLPECREKAVCTEKGENIEKYIEEVMNMTFDEYLLKCKQSYDTYYVSQETVDKELEVQMSNFNVDCHKKSPFFFRSLMRLSFILAKKIGYKTQTKY